MPYPISITSSPLHASSQETNSTEQDKTLLYAEWNIWEQSGEPDESRDTAVQRMKDCYEGNQSEHLDLNGLNLCELPPIWPPRLTEIDISDNQLAQLSNNFPVTLKAIYASKNKLTGLMEIERLATNPAFLPEIIDVSNNHLTQLLDTPIFSLTEIDASRNLLTSISDAITSLSPECAVSLKHNSFSEEEQQRLRDLIAQPDYSGPNISPFSSEAAFAFTSSDESDAGSDDFAEDITIDAASIKDIMSKLYSPVSDPQIETIWCSYASEENAPEFFRFLDKLTKTKSMKHEDFKRHVCDWLSQLAVVPSLRIKTFELAYESTTTCSDRVSLTFSQMQNARTIDSVETGEYDGNLPGLISIARDIFRGICLEAIAMGRAETLAQSKDVSRDEVDDIGVHLAYKVGLCESLQLRSAIREMHYFSDSGVTQENLNSVKTTVKHIENAEFKNWLAIWPPWNTVLERLHKPEYLLAEQKRRDASDEPLQKRIRTDLAEFGLQKGDATFNDAYTQSATKHTKQMTAEIKIALTDNFLKKNKLESAVMPFWVTEGHPA